ncbi:cytochrome P450 [Rhypophila decipiens]|uniref:Cytochrome P450 n=1 Tax=Rhypophila decipiens TaxID=261697 RepID=A0AAN6XUX5_9PEZI|nr:cytochrome P450 [Rhypophila decipiens]
MTDLRVKKIKFIMDEAHIIPTALVFAIALILTVLVLLIVGVSQSRFRFLREPLTIISSWTNLTENTLSGFNKFSKVFNTPFILPTTWASNSRLVILPPSQLHTIMNKPESELTAFWALIEHLMLQYFIDISVFDNLIHFDVSKKDLSRANVHRQAASTAEEIELAFGDIWGGHSTHGDKDGNEKPGKAEWKYVNGWEACTRVILRVGMRTLVGEEMCRDENLLRQTELFSNALFGGVAILHCTPTIFRGFVGAIVGLPTRWYGWKCSRIFIPLVKERLRLWKAREVAVGRGEKVDDLPNDFLQWLIARCASHGPEHLDPHKITTRMLALNTMFVFAMGYVFAHAVIDLCVSPNRDEFFAGLEEECIKLLAQHPGGLADRDLIDKLYRADSTLRESMRLSAISVVSLPRDVVGQPLDIGNGMFVPAGTRIAFPTLHMQLDPDLYQDAGRFDAFRFSRPAEESPGEEHKQDLMYTPTPGFLPFGYGRKACPGRWYVSQTVKQALAYLALHYDVELVGPGPERKALLNTMIPPTGTQLRIRRKEV